jgi:hypothetical protein
MANVDGRKQKLLRMVINECVCARLFRLHTPVCGGDVADGRCAAARPRDSGGAAHDPHAGWQGLIWVSRIPTALSATCTSHISYQNKAFCVSGRHFCVSCLRIGLERLSQSSICAGGEPRRRPRQHRKHRSRELHSERTRLINACTSARV